MPPLQRAALMGVPGTGSVVGPQVVGIAVWRWPSGCGDQKGTEQRGASFDDRYDGGAYAPGGIGARKRFTRAAMVFVRGIAASARDHVPSVRAASSKNAPVYGPFGPEGPRLREQLWVLPSADHALSAARHRVSP